MLAEEVSIVNADGFHQVKIELFDLNVLAFKIFVTIWAAFNLIEVGIDARLVKDVEARQDPAEVSLFDSVLAQKAVPPRMVGQISQLEDDFLYIGVSLSRKFPAELYVRNLDLGALLIA